MTKIILRCVLYLTCFTVLSPSWAGADAGGWVVVPFPIYTPETSGAITLTALRYLRLHEDAHASSFMVSGAYSLRQQVSLRLTPEVSVCAGKGWFEGDVFYEYWPDKFYGVGHDSSASNEEEYTSKIHGLEGTLLRQVFSNWSMGIVAEYRHYEILKAEDGGLLAARSIPGSNGAAVWGGGPVVAWDSRDNRFAPHRGCFLKVSGIAYYEKRNDLSFQRITLDARQYLPLTTRSVLAVQQYVSLIHGDAPFQELSRIGDIREISIMRGYYSGRYLDNNVTVLQGECRYPIAKRLSGTLFGGIGIIGGNLTRRTEQSLYGSGGAGLRYRASAAERINLRLDVAFGRDTSGVYFGLMEAF